MKRVLSLMKMKKSKWFLKMEMNKRRMASRQILKIMRRKMIAVER